jgi:hypothetical protein
VIMAVFPSRRNRSNVFIVFGSLSEEIPA